MVKDDCGDQLGEDFDKAVYRDLIELYTSPADWVVNIQLATGEVAKILDLIVSPGTDHISYIHKFVIQLRVRNF